MFQGIIYPLSYPVTHTPLQIYCDLIFILFRRLFLGGVYCRTVDSNSIHIYCGFINKKNKWGSHISLKLGKIFNSHIVLFYALNDLYLFFIANPDFWPCKYLFGTFPGRQACQGLEVWLQLYILFTFSVVFLLALFLWAGRIICLFFYWEKCIHIFMIVIIPTIALPLKIEMYAIWNKCLWSGCLSCMSHSTYLQVLRFFTKHFV